MNQETKTGAGILIAIVASLVLLGTSVYAFPSSTQSIGTSNVSDCGFGTVCTAYNPSGLRLSLSVNSTTVVSNSSMHFEITLVNPTSQFVNISSSDEWYLPGLPTSYGCHSPSIPYALSVFSGRYTLANISSAVNILHPAVYPSCLREPNVTGFSFPPLATFSTPYTQQSADIYAIDGGFVKSGNSSIGVGVYSLWSSKPSTYTIVAGDEWGDLVLLNFLVVLKNP